MLSNEELEKGDEDSPKEEDSKKLTKKKEAETVQLKMAEDEEGGNSKKSSLPAKSEEIVAEEPPSIRPASLFAQFQILLSRRWKIFFRDRGQVLLQLAILICFPILVTLFSERGKDNIRKLSDAQEESMADEFKNRAQVQADNLKVGSDVSGIIMFEVILLALMGSNNAAREIAGERLIMEKEKFGGVRPLAFLMSKVSYLSALVLAQSLWMAFFVEWFWPFRGDFMTHALFLILINAAITSICLAISSLARTAEQGSLLSIYLVGFQLPLSGAVLALPIAIEPFAKPFISAYWAWAGSVDALKLPINDAVKFVVETNLVASNQAFTMLLAHVLIGLFVAYLGIRRHQWD